MTREISEAFDHPEARSITSAAAPLDRISLRDHIVAVEIGAFQAERDMTQRISFDIVVEVRQIAEDLGDDVDLILSYDRVTEAIDTELAAERLNLLETLAERVAARILREPQAERVFVRIQKLDRGAGALGVEIVRSADQVPAPQTAAPLPRPVLVYLGHAALASEHLGGWIDQLSQGDAPLVLCVPAPDAPRPRAASAAAQQRIDLLAIEQNAWVLAARDPRCVVVQTRTELDWALKNGQISVWAPAKFVLDAVGGPVERAGAPAELALWCAQQIGAGSVIALGETLPKTADLPCRSLPATQARI